MTIFKEQPIEEEIPILALPEKEEDYLENARRQQEENQAFIFQFAETTERVQVPGSIEIGILGGRQILKEFPDMITETTMNPRFPLSTPENVVSYVLFPATVGATTKVFWQRNRSRETGNIDNLYVVSRRNGVATVHPTLSSKGTGASNPSEVERFQKTKISRVQVGQGGSATPKDFGISHRRGAELEMQVLEELNDCGGRGSIVIGHISLSKEKFLDYCHAHYPEYYQALRNGIELNEDIEVQIRFSDPHRISDVMFIKNFHNSNKKYYGEAMTHSFQILSLEYQLNEKSNPGSFERYYNIHPEISLSHLQEKFNPNNPQHIEAQTRLIAFLMGRNFAILAKLGYSPAIELRDIGWTATVHDAERVQDNLSKEHLKYKMEGFSKAIVERSGLSSNAIISAINLGISSVQSSVERDKFADLQRAVLEYSRTEGVAQFLHESRTTKRISRYGQKINSLSGKCRYGIFLENLQEHLQRAGIETQVTNSKTDAHSFLIGFTEDGEKFVVDATLGASVRYPRIFVGTFDELKRVFLDSKREFLLGTKHRTAKHPVSREEWFDIMYDHEETLPF